LLRSEIIQRRMRTRMNKLIRKVIQSFEMRDGNGGPRKRLRKEFGTSSLI